MTSQKIFTTKNILFILISLFVYTVGWGQVSENFDNWLDSIYGTTSTYTDGNGGQWETYNTICQSLNARSGNAIRFNDDSGENEYLLYKGLDGNGKDDGIGVISFWYRHWDGDGSTVQFQVQYNQSGAGWTNVGSVVSVSSTTYLEFTNTVNLTGDDILIRVISIDDAERLLIDDFEITNFTSTDTVDWCNLENPASGSVILGGIFSVDAYVYEAGVTDPAGQGSGIEAWIGYSTTDATNVSDFASGWTWVLAAYDGDDNNNDEYYANIMGGITATGTYYYVSRFRLNSGPFSYGGTDSDGSGGGDFWDGINYVSGVLTVNPHVIDWCNLQFPNTHTMLEGNDFTVYARVYENGVTNPAGQGPGITAWIGYSTSNTNPDTWTNWVSATYNVDVGNNDEYMATFGSALAPGTYYYASRFDPDGGTTHYGGYSGGGGNFWDGTTYISGILTIQEISDESDIITNGNESTTVSSLENDATITTVADGVEVWQFIIRDGGSDVTDTDTLATIMNSITITQDSGNAMQDWSDAILACALFDDTNTLVSNSPTITTNQIQFTGLTFNVTDNTSETLSLRISIQTNPNDSGSNNDGDDFVFQISNTNVIADATGSQFDSFTATQSINEKNIFDVTATELQFTVQPTDIGQNAIMNPVPEVSATDANGNVDLDYTGDITLTSTGTMTVTSPIAAVSGVATYNDVVHTVLGTNLTLTASATGLIVTSTNFDVLLQTDLQIGDLAILAVNTDIDNDPGGNNDGNGDELAFVCFKDILPGTKIYITDNGYERLNANQWGNTEGIFAITRTGTTLAKGTIIAIQANSNTNGSINDINDFDIFSCGIIDVNWTKECVACNSGFDLNKDDDIWIMQGGNWENGTTNSHDATYDGIVLYGWTESGWNNVAPNGSDRGTKFSNLFPSSKCFSTVAPTGDGKVKFDDPINPDFSTTTNTHLDWIALINTTSNWTPFTNNSDYNTQGYNYVGNTVCPAMTIATGTTTDGIWTGATDTDWFNCRNWQSLRVPDETIDVTIGASATRASVVDDASTDAGFYGGIAKCNNLNITTQTLTLDSDANDKLEVHGNLTINGGELDMENASPSGQLYLYGNWSNNAENKFIEGEGSVHFLAVSPQTVTCNSGTETEKFYNVEIDNATGVTFASGNIHAAGDLTLQNSPAITITADHYLLAGKNLHNNTSITIEHEGSLVQTDDAGIVTGGGSYTIKKTTREYVHYDYTYWSSPIDNESIGSVFAANPSSYIFSLNTANFLDENHGNYPQSIPGADSFDDNGNDWVHANGSTIMSSGVGYIAMGAGSPFPITNPPSTGTATQSVLFDDGRINFGNITVPVSLDAYTYSGSGTDYSSFNTEANLIGNPYPSAVDLVALVAEPNNAELTGDFYFWSHNTAITSGNSGPDFYNFTNDDYATYVAGTGGAAAHSGGLIPTQFVASGQGFLANVNANGSIVFKNSMRVITGNDSFFKNSKTEKDRVWLNLMSDDNIFRQILVAFVDGASDIYDRFDGDRLENGNNTDFYSLPSDISKRLAVQGLATFNNTKTIPLGLEIITAGEYMFSIDHVEGIFETTQDIYIKDYLTNTLHNLSQQGKYLFSISDTELGVINQRFELRFVDATASIDEDVIDNITVYPNPSNALFNISWKAQANTHISVYDITGKLIKTDVVQQNTAAYQLDLSGYAKGFYFVRIKLDGQQVVKKIMLK